MSWRLRLARGLLRLGAFVQSLPVVIMKPDDLVTFSRQTYTRPDSVDSWAEDELVDSGLRDDELNLLTAVPAKTGYLLLLGVGGGRETIPLARMGFRVTGVDFVPAMVDRAVENAAARGVTIDGLVQEISKLDVAAEAYDVVWLSRSMYSCVPTRARRVRMARRVAQALKPGGVFLCQFHWDPQARHSRMGVLVRRVIAACTLGNLAYEEGDRLWLNVEFSHAFSSEQSIRSELEEGGFSVERMTTDEGSIRGWAVCRKRPEIGKDLVNDEEGER